MRAARCFAGSSQPEEPPADLKEWAALAGTIARNYAIDQVRKRKKRERDGYAGLTDEEDGIEPLPNDDWRDPIDAKRLVGILEEQFRDGEMPEHGEVILEATAADAAQKERSSGSPRVPCATACIGCGRPSRRGWISKASLT